MELCVLNHNMIFKMLKYFQGKWSFERSISKPALRARGKATFTELSKDTLSYYECGTYTVDEIMYDFFQKRVFSCDGVALYIYKRDNSLLHKFELDRRQAFCPVTLKHDHVCGKDLYSCTLIFNTEKSFSINYQIFGINKDYEIRTIFTKD